MSKKQLAPTTRKKAGLRNFAGFNAVAPANPAKAKFTLRSIPMAFTLPDLPYPHDALAPHMSRETLEFHHDKHHLAYVNTGNNLAKGTEWENKSVEEVVKGTFGKNPGLFNNAAQHFNHIHFWKWMKKGGGGDKLP